MPHSKAAHVGPSIGRACDSADVSERVPYHGGAIPREAVEIVNLINRLREREGSSVLICCENPDGCGPDNQVIEVADDWTNWQPMRFVGRTLTHALQNAVIEMEQRRKRMR